MPETPEETEEPIKQRKNGLYPGVSDELAENMKSGWADTELHGLEPIAAPRCPPASPASAW
jgi:Xaa-Pro aminopeptidase